MQIGRSLRRSSTRLGSVPCEEFSSAAGWCDCHAAGLLGSAHVCVAGELLGWHNEEVLVDAPWLSDLGFPDSGHLV